MLPIMDIGLKTALLATLIERLETGDIEDLISVGIPAEDLESLRKLTAADLTRVARHHQLAIRYHLSPLALSNALNAIKVQSNYDVELEAFVRAGASLSMLRQFFRGGAEQVKLYRMMLDPNKQAGRSEMPELIRRDAIHQAWGLLKSDRSLDSQLSLKATSIARKTLLQLHEQFSDLTLEILFAVICEFESKNKANINAKGAA